MAEFPDSPLSVLFEVTRKVITNITEWEITSNYITSTDGFSFTVYADNMDDLRNLELQPVTLSVNGAQQVVGRIDKTTMGNNGTAVTFYGRDYIADLVECNVDPLLKIKTGDSIASAFTDAAGPVGIDTVISDDDLAMRNVRTGVSVKFKKGGRGYAKRILNEYKPHSGEGLYEFLNRLIQRFGATIQPGNARNILVITAPHYEQDPTYTLYRSMDPTISGINNVISSVADRDYSSFPTYSLFTGKQVVSDSAQVACKQENDVNDLAALQNSEVAAILADSTVAGRRVPGVFTALGLGQLYRLLFLVDKEARTQEQVSFAATRAIADRLKSTLEYKCTVRGHIDPVSGAIWSIDTMVRVADEVCGVFEPLWIVERTLKLDPKGGATTDLVCYRPASFQFGNLDGTEGQ